MRQLFAVAIVTTMLAACSGADTKQQPTAIVKSKAHAPTLREADPEAFHKSIGAAMAEIPQAQRQQFQKLFICEVRKNNQTNRPRPVDADYVRELTEYLKANPTAGDTCSSKLG